jgi:histidinol phosphatase-like enzyme
LNHPGGCERNEIAPIMNNSTLFLGRDGVINVDRGYVYRPEQFDFVAGIFELARFWTNELRRPIVVVTNQSSAGRGPIHLVERRSYDLPTRHFLRSCHCRVLVCCGRCLSSLQVQS